MSDARIKAVIRLENNENLIAIKIKTSPVNSINRWPTSHEIIERTFITGSTNIYKSRIDSNNIHLSIIHPYFLILFYFHYNWKSIPENIFLFLLFFSFPLPSIFSLSMNRIICHVRETKFPT